MPARDNYVQLENVRIVFRNFEGRKEKYNKEGDRNFHVVLDPGTAERMAAEGWNVKMKPPREEGDDPFFHLKVTVRFEGRTPPRIILISSRGRNTLDEDTAGLMDFADFITVDLILRPYDWTLSDGKTGRSAYLVAVYGVLYEDDLDKKYAAYDEINRKPAIGRTDEEFGEPDFD